MPDSNNDQPTTDPAINLQAVETTLRRLIREVLGSSWTSAQGAPDLAQLNARAEEERKRRDGAVVSDDLLSYTDFYSLSNIIQKNWQRFQPALGDLQRTKVFLGIIEDFRNSVAHSRQLLDFEKNLLSGASGQLRNQVALYLNRNDGPHRYYPRIESISNDFGLIEDKYFEADLYISKPRLNVADVLNFTCAATDPRGREISWLLYLERRRGENETLDEAEGSTAILRWRIQEQDVGEKQWLTVVMKHNGRHHRWTGGGPGHGNHPWREYDDVRDLTYSVNPPLD